MKINFFSTNAEIKREFLITLYFCKGIKYQRKKYRIQQ